ncbi:MAG: ECF-type sigma factor [Bryobacteraceae bacterium]
MALSSDEQSNVRELLRLAGGGDKAAEEELFRIVYTELRRIARYAMQGERPDHTLQPAALVHEAFVRLVGEQIPWNNRAHFFAVAATTMRRVLIDYARSLGAQKRQAGKRISLDGAFRS